MELFHGSPTDMTGRRDREVRTYAFLDLLVVFVDLVESRFVRRAGQNTLTS